jgi:ubiquinone/menaquinone biosynthesis C-methylase UbiE
MNFIEHEKLWNLDALVKEYSVSIPELTTPETFLLEKAVGKLKDTLVEHILCVGCGGGREVLPLHKSFSDSTIYANDISINMLSAAKNNFENWGISNYTKTLLSPANELPITQPFFKLITCFNNVIGCITSSEQRNETFKKLFNIMHFGGVLIGMVHNMYGTPQKTMFFLLQKLVSSVLKNGWGDRIAGRKNQKYKVHHFNKRQITSHLKIAGFKNVEIFSLGELYSMKRRRYNRLKGSNNLIFIARK